MLQKNLVRSLLFVVAALSFSATFATGGDILLIVADPTGTTYTADALIKTRLEALGHTVRYFDDNNNEAAMEDAAAAVDLVYISESVGSGNVHSKITEIEVPIIVGEPWAWDEMGMTIGSGGSGAVATNDIDIVNSGHYLAAGLSGTVPVISNTMGPEGPAEFAKGSVGGDGAAIATATLADGQTYDVLLVYDKGDRLAAPPADGSPQFAADIRIGMFFHYLAQPVLNQNGWALVEAAVNYALGITERAAVAKNPQPADGATGVPRDVILNWMPGAFAPASNAHRVFFSEVFTDVDGGLGGIAQDANSYDPGGVDFETTYYWRVDEVNAPPDSTVHRGAVWSFTTEPIGYPIENVTVTASSFNKDSEKPENAINGSGLDADDLHSSDGATMWLSDVMDPNIAWIQCEFDKSYKLYQMLVWNYNSTVEPAVGFGIKEATIEYSVDGVNWSVLGTAYEFAQGPGEAGYANDTTVDFLGVIARYVRITANSNWSPWGLKQYGLSEVRLLHIPIWAREPSPDSGATDVPVGGIISFRAGREAARHDLYLSTDEQSVISGASPVTTVTEPSYAASLDLASTYYWRIDEVNEAETPSTWRGDLWDFATQEYIVVDGFEDYNDWPPHEIYATWADGYEDPTNGSQVGNLTPPFAEPGIVHGGMQSMPLFYDNTGDAEFSEATRTFAAGQDWTKHGIKTLSLWFYGAGGNTGQLYVKINGVKVSYDGKADNIAAGFWLPWNIDLTAAGVNVQTVTTLAIGIDGNAAAGTLYLDDVRLYAYDRQFITPAEPGNAGLVGHFKLDEDTTDSSGNNSHGTLDGNLQWAPGKIGGALSFVGATAGDHVEIPTTGVSVSAGTIAIWGKLAPDPQVPATRYFFGHTVGPGWSNRIQLYMDDSDTILDLGLGDSHNTYKNIITLATDVWYHIALTWDGSNYTVYVNGAPMANGGYAGLDTLSTVADIGNDGNVGGRTEAFNGLLDDVHIYNRVLSTAEIAGLAGWTKPFDKPF